MGAVLEKLAVLCSAQYTTLKSFSACAGLSNSWIFMREMVCPLWPFPRIKIWEYRNFMVVSWSSWSNWVALNIFFNLFFTLDESMIATTNHCILLQLTLGKLGKLHGKEQHILKKLNGGELSWWNVYGFLTLCSW